MRGVRAVVAMVLALAATPAGAKRPAPPGFAEPGDIIAAEGAFSHISADKGLVAAIRATATPDAQIFAPGLLRVTDYLRAATGPAFPQPWHTAQLWMSCDGSIAVTHGTWQPGGAATIGWYVTVWQRQKNGGYKWVLEEGGALPAAPAASDMIAASVADCPVGRARPATPPPAGEHGKAIADHTSGHADDGTLEWATVLAADGSRSFTVRLKQDGALREVLHAAAAPKG